MQRIRFGIVSVCLLVGQFSGLSWSQEGEQTLQIEEVVVTAQKRSESIRDVPLSMTVMSEALLKEAGMENLRDIAKFTPNVEINPELRSAKMRGIGGSAGALVEPAVALVVDGVFYGRNTYLFMSLLDIERVEVLRGPQGLIVGKNASAGAITFYSHRPEFEPSVFAEVQVGRFDELRRDATLNMPLLDDRAALRVAVSDHRRDGAFYNTTRDEQDGELDSTTGRASLLVDITDNLEWLLVAGQADRYQSVNLSQFTVASDQTKSLYRSFDPAFEDDPGDFQSSHDYPEWREHNGDWASSEFNWQFEHFLLTAVSGWADSVDAFQAEGDRGPAALMKVFGDEHYRQITHELRLVSNPGVLEYTAGVYSFESDLSGFQRVEIGALEDLDLSALSNNLGLPGLIGDTLIPLIDDLTTLPSAIVVDGDFTLDTKTRAVFGQLKYNITDALSLTAGARYTREKKAMLLRRENKPDGLEPVLEAALNAQEFTERRSLQEKDTAWSVSAAYELTDELTTYVTRSRGFKSGGFNSAALQVDNIQYEPEESNTWEAGLKGRYFGGLLMANIGLYKTDFDNMQVLTRRPGILNGLVASNAAAARVQGVEADAVLALTRHLRLFATLAYNDAEFVDYRNAQCTESSSESSCDLSGRPLPDAPEWKGSVSLGYSRPLPWFGLEARFRADALYSGFEYQTLDLDPLDARDSFWEYNASIGVGDSEGRWSLTVQQFNVTDELIRLSSGDVPLAGGSHAANFDLPRRTVAKFSVTF